ncbi:MAG: iron-containing alcohol dehydrogenase [Candidatus Cloacimonetes bacterium]|nr:iron-containing alcohol dehydrogenase [Candidatus Cloacimonadota bacterium]
MESFSFHNPTRIHFGTGMIKQIGPELKQAGIGKCLLVAGGGSIRANSVYDQVTASLRSSQIAWAEAWGVQSNPTLAKVRELIELARAEEVQAILAVGGGSVIDSAKATAAGFYLPDVWDAFTGKERVSQALPVFTVLTLSATGSEMNGNAVITNTAEQKKWSIGSPLLYPRVSIIDPSVQCSLPWRQTVNGALDATAHILEYFFMDSRPEATLAIDAALLKTITAMANRLQQDPCDLDARGSLAWSATLALNGISGAGLKGGDWACHTIEHAFSVLDPKIAHGEGLGVIFPAWIEYVSEKEPARFARWASSVFAADSVAQALHMFRDQIEAWGSATSLRGLCLRENQLPELRDIIMQSRSVGRIFKFSAADIEALLMLAY